MFQSLKNRRQSSEEQVDELLSAYLDGVMPREDRTILEARLRQELALVARLEGLRQTKKALASLPKVEVPRNFIVTPAMVAPPRSVAPPRRRRTWPVFGWATAVATLLLLLVFAGDLLFVTPSRPAQPSDIVAAKPALPVQTLGERETERASAAMDVAVGEVEAPVQEKTEDVVLEAEAQGDETPQVERFGAESAATEVVEPEIALEAEAPPPVAESEAVPAEAVSEEMVEGILTPPASGAGGGAPTQEAEIPAEEARTALGVETPGIWGTPAPGVVVTAAVEAEEVIVAAPMLAEDVIAEQVPQAAAPPAEEQEAEGDIATQPSPQQKLETEPVAVAIEPLNLTPAAVGAAQDTDDVTSWLRLAEIGLGLAIVALAMVTLILRRREVRSG